MADLIPRRPRTASFGPEPTSLLDRRAEEIRAEHRWRVRAAQWRAAALAAQVFGPQARAELSGGVLDGPFRALLHLEVPFAGLDDHRAREARFTAMAGIDPVLSAVPMVYVFNAAGP